MKVRIGREIDFGESVFGYVAAGAGAAVVPLRSVDRLPDPRLRAVPIADFGERRVILLAARSPAEGRKWLRYFHESPSDPPSSMPNSRYAT